MIEATVLTHWVKPKDDTFEPYVFGAHPIKMFQDVTAQTVPPSLNNVAAFLVHIENEDFKALDADVKVFTVAWDYLGSDPGTPIDETPKNDHEESSASEFGRLRAFLAIAGVSQAWISNAIGTNVSKRTRKEITSELIAEMRNLQ